MIRCIVICLVVILLSGSNEIFSQKKKSKSLEWNLESKLYFKHNNNVFRLLDKKHDRLENNNSSDLISGRFRDMNSPDDYILKPFHAQRIHVSIRNALNKQALFIANQSFQGELKRKLCEQEEKLKTSQALLIQQENTPSSSTANRLF